MADYIKREEVIEAFDDPRVDRYYGDVSPSSVIDVIKTIHAADVRENVRGKWEKGWNVEESPDYVFPAWQCSVCGSFTDENPDYEPRFKYCPWCGAEMIGENDG